MRLIDLQPQLIIRDESLVENLSIDSKYVIYSGLGHVVLNVTEIKKDNTELLEKIKEVSKDNYFFRISIMMNNEEDKDVLYRIVNKNMFDFKPKILQDGNHCLLGIECYIVKLEKLSSSKNFKQVTQYHCTINHVNIDNNGDIHEEILWDKSKYGEIESFLPKELISFKPVLEFMRDKNFLEKRLYKLTSNSSTKKEKVSQE